MTKKTYMIGLRVDETINKIIERLAKKDDRAIASMARKLVLEALEVRGLLKSDKKKKS